MLLRTSEANGHTHFAYVRPNGAGMTSIVADHTHEIYTDVIEMPVTDPNTGQPAIDPNTGQPIIDTQTETKIGEAKNHTHELSELYYATKADRFENDDEIIKDSYSLFKDAYSLEETSRNNGVISKKFIRGDQWDDSIKAELAKNNRAMLVINESKSVRDKLSGMHRQSRTDTTLSPTEEGDERVAEMLNILLLNIYEQNGLSFEETQIFDDMVDVGRGNFFIDIDRTRNIEGDIIIGKSPWKEVWYGPHDKLDGSDCEYTIKAKWFSKDLGEQVFGKKFKDVPTTFGMIDEDTKKSNRPVGDKWADTIFSGGNAVKLKQELVNKQKKLFRVLEVKKKVYNKVPILFNLEDNTFINLGNIADEDYLEILTIPIVFSRDVINTRVMVAIIAGKVVLSKYYSEFGEFLNDIPAYANKDEEYFWGKIEELKDMQRETNYRHSQAVETIRRTILRNRYYDDDTFDDVQERNFIENANSPGGVFKVKDINHKPEPENDVRFPGEIVQMEELASRKLKELSNVDVDVARFSNIASGVGVREIKKDSIIGNEYIFDNLMLAKRQLVKVILKAVQVVYTPDRIYRVLDNRFRSGKSAIPLDATGNPKFSMDEVMALLENADLTKYDVAIDESKHSPTRKAYNFMLWAEMARNGFPVPPAFLIELSDLPNKGSFLAMMQAQAEAQQQQERMKYDVELQKTMIAAQSKQNSEGGGIGQNLIPAQ